MSELPPVPTSLRRLLAEVDGWLELDCPDKALERMGPLLETPGARPVGLVMRIRARIAKGLHQEALEDLAEARSFALDSTWLDLTEAWCRKRTGDLARAIACMEDVLAREPRHAVAMYNLGCYLALAGERERALDLVTRACGMEERLRMEARTEPDLNSLREDPRFRAILGE